MPSASGTRPPRSAPSAPRASTSPTGPGSRGFFADLSGPIDHVLTTGPGPLYAPLPEMDLDAAGRHVAERITSVLAVARSGAPRMRPPGTLLFIGGTGGRQAGIGLSLISAMTAALPALVASLAVELAPVRVNVVAAGFVDTPLSVSLLGDQLDARRTELRTTLHRPRRRAGRRRGVGGAPHGQLGAHGRHLRHRRWAAAAVQPRREDMSMAVAALADLLHETSEHHGAFEAVAPPHDWWDWYAAYMVARQGGATPDDAAAAAGRYMADEKHIVVTPP